jgi:hypothetical protein
VVEIVEEVRRAQHLKARVDADEKLRWSDPGLDGAQLHALDHPRDGSELTGGKDLALDLSLTALLQPCGVALAPFVLHVVQRGGGALQRDGCGRRRRRGAAGEHDQHGERDDDGRMGCSTHDVSSSSPD